MSRGTGLSDLRSVELVAMIHVLARMANASGVETAVNVKRLQQTAKILREAVFNKYRIDVVKEPRLGWGYFAGLCTLHWNNRELERLIRRYRGRNA